VAVFGEGTVTFFDKLDVTLGARYEREKRERVGSLGSFVIDLDETFDAFLPKLGIAYRPGDRFTYGATVQRGFNAGGAGIAFVPPFPSFTFGEEFVWNYEAFFRSRWLDDRLTVNGNVFYADFEDQQRSAFFAPNDPFASVIRNAESTRSYGAELTANWLARQDLEVFGALGVLETEIEEFTDSAKDLSGNEFALAPNVTASLGATYRHASGLSIGFDGQYGSSYFSDDDNDPAGQVDSFVVFNAKASYEIKHYRLFAFVTNLFDKDYELLIDTAGGGSPATAQLGDPREFGVGVEVGF
jgi:iron complex outermembrane recepter protein